jgi:hypothetical protein
MTDRVKWTELAPGMWVGRVDDVDAYAVLELESSAWVTRYGVRDGFRMTNVNRAKEIAELQEEMDVLPLLNRHGLLLPAA